MLLALSHCAKEPDLLYAALLYQQARLWVQIDSLKKFLSLDRHQLNLVFVNTAIVFGTSLLLAQFEVLGPVRVVEYLI